MDESTALEVDDPRASWSRDRILRRIRDANCQPAEPLGVAREKVNEAAIIDGYQDGESSPRRLIPFQPTQAVSQLLIRAAPFVRLGSVVAATEAVPVQVPLPSARVSLQLGTAGVCKGNSDALQERCLPIARVAAEEDGRGTILHDCRQETGIEGGRDIGQAREVAIQSPIVRVARAARTVEAPHLIHPGVDQRDKGHPSVLRRKDARGTTGRFQRLAHLGGRREPIFGTSAHGSQQNCAEAK